MEQEIARLSKRSDQLKIHLNGVQKKLANENFVNQAPKNVVEHEKKKLEEMTEEFEIIKTNLDILK